MPYAASALLSWGVGKTAAARYIPEGAASGRPEARDLVRFDVLAVIHFPNAFITPCDDQNADDDAQDMPQVSADHFV